MVRPTQTYNPRTHRSSGLPSRRSTRLQSKKPRTSDPHRLSERLTNLKTSPVEANSSGKLCNGETPVQRDSQDNFILSPNQDPRLPRQRLNGCGALLSKEKSIQQPKPLPTKRSHDSLLGEQLEQRPSCPTSGRYSSDPEIERRRDRPSDSLLDHSVPNLTHRENLTWESQSERFSCASPTFDALDNSSQSSEMSLTTHITYRVYNLAQNNIYLLSRLEQLPEHILILVNDIENDHDFSSPSISDVWQDRDLEALELNAGEALVQSYFQNKLFPSSAGVLMRSERSPISKHLIPHNNQIDPKISIPVPDLLFGYNHTEAFTEGQQLELSILNSYMAINSDMLIYPFLMVEFKADGPSGAGGLWAATNQCLGGSAACVNNAEHLNQRLRQLQSSGSQPIDSRVFSIAMSGTEARLYITWKHNDNVKYYTVKVKSFLLQVPESYLEFRKYLLNIVDWGTTRRLDQIREALGILLEEGRSRTSGKAKSRPSPSDFTRSSKKLKL